MKTYEQKIVDNNYKIQDLSNNLKKVELEKDHLKGLYLKLQKELEEKEEVLNITLSPLKKHSTNLEKDFIEEDLPHVKKL